MLVEQCIIQYRLKKEIAIISGGGTEEKICAPSFRSHMNDGQPASVE